MQALASPRLRGNALRDQVLETALDLFTKHGYFNTSIHDIRRAAGVSTGAIYHHFHNKETLAKSLYDSLVAYMEEAISAACEGQTGYQAQGYANIPIY